MGKLISSKASIGASVLIEGEAWSIGLAVVSSESGVGPYLEPIGCDNSCTVVVSTGPVFGEPELKEVDTSVPVDTGCHTDELAKYHLLGTAACSGPVSAVVW